MTRALIAAAPRAPHETQGNQLLAAVGQNNNVPVLIFGTGITALGVIRGLARIGIRAYCVTEQENFVQRSRWYHTLPGGYRLDSRDNDLELFLDKLPLSQAVLIPCHDSWVMVTARLTGELKQRFPASQPSATTLKSLVDKGSLARILAENHIPHPRTVPLDSEHDLRKLLAEMPHGVFLKPCNSEVFFKRYQVKALRINSPEEAIEYYTDIRQNKLEVILQEYIPGPPTNHYFIDGFVDRTGRVCASFVRQRIRMYPPDFGNSTFLVSSPIDKAAAAAADLSRLFSAVNYRGIYSAEFKYDERDGQYKLLEVNIRPWWYIWFADLCGVPVAAMAYRDALGLEVKPVETYKVGRKFVYPLYDLHAGWELHRRGELAIISWAKSWLGAMRPVACWRDPLPALTCLAGEIRRIVRKRVFNREN